MLPLPKVILVLEQRLGDRRGIFPVLPLRPVLAEVPTVPEHVRAECGVGEDQVVTLFG